MYMDPVAAAEALPSGGKSGIQKNEAKGLQLLLVVWDAGDPQAVRDVPQLIVGSTPETLSSLAEQAKLIFAPADAKNFSASQLKGRADQLWQRMKDGKLNVSDLPSSFVARINAKQSESVPLGKPPSFAVHVIQYSRHPSILRSALLEGEELRICRDALAANGFSAEQPSGAKVFVLPEQFDSVLSAIDSLDLKPWHVVVSEEFEKAVDQAVKRLPSQAQVREKQRTHVPSGPCASCGMVTPRFTCQRCNLVRYCSRGCQQQNWRDHKKLCIASQENVDDSGFPVVLKRTFLEVPVQSSLRSSQVSGDKTKSTTDADPRKGMNPRKA